MEAQAAAEAAAARAVARQLAAPSLAAAVVALAPLRVFGAAPFAELAAALCGAAGALPLPGLQLLRLLTRDSVHHAAVRAAAPALAGHVRSGLAAGTPQAVEAATCLARVQAGDAPVCEAAVLVC